jgi:sporulation protein YlmC with PRC-barrel domain
MTIKQILSGTTLAAALLLTPQFAAAQSSPNQPAQNQPAQTRDGAFTRSDTQGQPAVPTSQNYTQSMERLFQSAQRLREAVQAMAQQPAGERRNQAMAQAREALRHTQQAMLQLPAGMRTEQNYRDADAKLSEVQRSLEGQQSDPQQARGAVDAYLVLIPRMQADAARMDRSTTAGAPGAAAPGAVSGGTAGTGPQGAAMATGPAGLPLQRATNLVGTDVAGPDGKKLGEIENLLVDRNGQVRAMVLEWGGFLGIGDREVLVPMDQIQLGSGNDDQARTSLTREQLEKMPRFDRNRLSEYGRENNWGEGTRWFR